MHEPTVGDPAGQDTFADQHAAIDEAGEHVQVAQVDHAPSTIHVFQFAVEVPAEALEAGEAVGRAREVPEHQHDTGLQHEVDLVRGHAAHFEAQRAAEFGDPFEVDGHARRAAKAGQRA